jgi:hypothetical protein
MERVENPFEAIASACPIAARVQAIADDAFHSGWGWVSCGAQRNDFLKATVAINKCKSVRKERAENRVEKPARAVGIPMRQGMQGWHRWHGLGMENYFSSRRKMAMLGECLSILIFRIYLCHPCQININSVMARFSMEQADSFSPCRRCAACAKSTPKPHQTPTEIR